MSYQSGKCDWCSTEQPTLVIHKDVNEGMFGPEYMVCRTCRTKESTEAQAELDAMDIIERLRFEW